MRENTKSPQYLEAIYTQVYLNKKCLTFWVQYNSYRGKAVKNVNNGYPILNWEDK